MPDGEDVYDAALASWCLLCDAFHEDGPCEEEDLEYECLTCNHMEDEHARHDGCTHPGCRCKRMEDGLG
jgi:hypothetical protein